MTVTTMTDRRILEAHLAYRVLAAGSRRRGAGPTRSSRPRPSTDRRLGATLSILFGAVVLGAGCRATPCCTRCAEPAGDPSTMRWHGSIDDHVASSRGSVPGDVRTPSATHPEPLSWICTDGESIDISGIDVHARVPRFLRVRRTRTPPTYDFSTVEVAPDGEPFEFESWTCVVMGASASVEYLIGTDGGADLGARYDRSMDDGAGETPHGWTRFEFSSARVARRVPGQGK